jgi:hypothetical protein
LTGLRSNSKTEAKAGLPAKKKGATGITTVALRLFIHSVEEYEAKNKARMLRIF